MEHWLGKAITMEPGLLFLMLPALLRVDELDLAVELVVVIFKQ
jgi:hypothetical protein